MRKHLLNEDEVFKRIKSRKLEELRKSGQRREQTNFDKPIQVTDATLFKVIQSQTLVLIDCWAPWCAPCRIMGPIVDEMAKTYTGKILFGKLNVDENQKTSHQYHIMSIPTLLVFKNGKLVDRIVGVMPRQMLESKMAFYVK